jgi:hypothetical protein
MVDGSDAESPATPAGRGRAAGLSVEHQVFGACALWSARSGFVGGFAVLALRPICVADAPMQERDPARVGDGVVLSVVGVRHGPPPVQAYKLRCTWFSAGVRVYQFR